jgi:hypothetical protein
MIGGLPGDSFVFMEFEECGGVLEVTALKVALDDSQLIRFSGLPQWRTITERAK